MHNNTSYDLIVIGAGPAGYSAAIRAAQMKASVLIIDKGSFGGTCLNWGCIPTKFLWESVTAARKIKRAADFGIEAELKGCNFPLMQAKKARATDLLKKSLRKLIEGYGITIIEGTGRFISNDTLAVQGNDGSSSTITGKKIIIATGSLPKSIPGLAIDHQKIIDSTDALNLASVPQKLLIIGGGAIGVEMATIFSNLGSEVLLIEKEPQLLPGEDGDLAAELRKILERSGVKVITGGCQFAELLPQYDKVLVVTGRQPGIDGLDLEKAGIAFTSKGITVDEHLQTSSGAVFAAGDVAGNCYLAYTAQAEGIIAAENALGQRRSPEYSTIPRVVFSQPPAASVGVRTTDGTMITGRFPLAASSRAFIEGERTGWVKIIADKASGRVIGGQVIGPHAEDLIAVIGMAIRHKLTVHDLRRELFFHPSLSEAIHGACEDATGSCVDLPNKT